jgi:hypothetical protein
MGTLLKAFQDATESLPSKQMETERVALAKFAIDWVDKADAGALQTLLRDAPGLMAKLPPGEATALAEALAEGVLGRILQEDRGHVDPIGEDLFENVKERPAVQEPKPDVKGKRSYDYNPPVTPELTVEVSDLDLMTALRGVVSHVRPGLASALVHRLLARTARTYRMSAFRDQVELFGVLATRLPRSEAVPLATGLLQRMERYFPRVYAAVLASLEQNHGAPEQREANGPVPVQHFLLLVQSYGAIRAHVEKTDALRCGRLLGQGMLAVCRRTGEKEWLDQLVEALRSVGPSLPAREAGELAGALATALIRLPEAREEDWAFVASLLERQQAVDLLKHPTCWAPVQSALLRHVCGQAKLTASSTWEVRDLLLRHAPDLDLDSAPRIAAQAPYARARALRPKKEPEDLPPDDLPRVADPQAPIRNGKAEMIGD